MWRSGHVNSVLSVYCLPGIRDLRYISREADDRIGREFTEPPPVHALCGIQVILTLCIIYQVSETYATSLERLMIVLVENLPNLHQSMHYVAFRSLLWVLLSVMPKGGTFQQIISGFGKWTAHSCLNSSNCVLKVKSLVKAPESLCLLVYMHQL